MSLLAVSLVALLFCTVACSSDPGQCSKVVLHAWCSANTTLEVARLYLECEGDFGFQERRCRVNKQGDLCGSFVDKLDDIKLVSETCIDPTMTNCSNDCRQRLEVVEDNVSCCINTSTNTILDIACIICFKTRAHGHITRMLMENLSSSGASHIHILPQFCNDSCCLICQR